MFANRRRSERHLCGGPAKLHLGLGTFPRSCTVVDISDGGVRMVAENVSIPPEFTIELQDGSVRRCRLAWKIESEFGGEFIDRRRL
jgi:hypothetical protein